MFAKLGLYISTLGLILASCGTAIASDSTPLDELSKPEKCSQTKEVFYRSQSLKSPTSDRSVYFDTVLRRTDGYKVSGGNNRMICLGGGGTPASNLVEASNNPRIVYTAPKNQHSHYVASPQSFSADGNYLVSNYLAYYGGDGETGIAIFKVGKDYQNITSEIKYCRQSSTSNYSASHISFEGFLSGSKLVVECNAVYGEVGDAERTWHEVIDLASKSIQKLSPQERKSLKNLKSYGSILSSGALMKVQYFAR